MPITQRNLFPALATLALLLVAALLAFSAEQAGATGVRTGVGAAHKLAHPNRCSGRLPARRARYSALKVKCATSRYLNRDDGRPQETTVITRVQITILAPPPDRPAARSRARKNNPAEPRPRQPRPDTRRDKITQIMASEPGRDWSGRELAGRLGVRPQVMLTQLAGWTRLGLLDGRPGRLRRRTRRASGRQLVPRRARRRPLRGRHAGRL